jgi:hypothetical protein
MTDDGIREDAERLARWSRCMVLGHNTFNSFTAVAEAADAVATRLLELLPPADAERWRWVYSKKCERDIGGRLNLTSRSGQVAATVFLHRDGAYHNWFVWDENGTGGENSAEPTVELAIVEAEKAVRRWGKFKLKESK